MFRAFYNEHKDRLFGYLLRKSGNYWLAADMMQESFTRYLESYGAEEENPALLFTIGRNLLLDAIRKDRSDVSYEDQKHASAVDQESAYQLQDEVRRVLAALQQLDDEDRDILSLLTSSGLPYREIAQITGNSEANIKVKIHRARIKLKKILREGRS